MTILGTGSFLTRTLRILVLLSLCFACNPCDADLPQSVAPLDALYRCEALFLRAEPLASSPDKAALIDALQALLDAPPVVEPDAAVVLQNDLWGLHERARSEVSDPQLQRIGELSARLAHRIAPADVRALAPPDALPEQLATAFPSVVEHGTEMPILSHESAFGFRRVFRIALSPDRAKRVLFSQLVAFDREGRIGVTRVVGEVEHLWFAHGLVGHADVWKLTRGTTPHLEIVDFVTHVPSLGADSFFIEEATPAPLDDAIPCVRCHEDDDTRSLPRPDLPARPRWQRVLDQLTVPSVGQ